MGNAARKARKAAGIKFTHPVKEATPLPMRRGAPRRQVMQHMEAAIQAEGSMPEWARPGRGDVTSSPKRNKVTVSKSPGKSKSITVVPPQAEPENFDSFENYANTIDGEKLELDPKPYRIGRNRYTKAEHEAMADLNLTIFSPRSKYEQDLKKYQ